MSDTGLVYNFTGTGKGKTSAALGIALRALGWGWDIAFLQFIKGDRETGEKRFFERYFPDTEFTQLGFGFTNTPYDHVGAARLGWERAATLLHDFAGELLILDELNVAMSHGLIPIDEVVAAVSSKRTGLNVVITGRGAPPELLAVCDLVSEVGELKHPYRRGIPARKGLDY